MSHEPEITTPVDLCSPDGQLNPAAVGWSRKPLQRCALPGAWGRRKRWDYWCITAEPWVFQITLADLDYASFVSLVAFRIDGGMDYQATAVRLGGSQCGQPDEVEAGDIHWTRGGVELSIQPTDDGTHLQASFRARGRRVRLAALVAPARDTLNVTVPWSPTRYQFTSKHVGRPVHGSLTIDGQRQPLEGFAALDYGRGRWPARPRWNWGAAASAELSLQIGAQWTDGTGVTENGLFVGGRLHKIGEELTFDYAPKDPLAPWQIRSRGARTVALEFQPVVHRPLAVPGLAGLDLCFGHYSGEVVLPEGTFAIDRLFGWAEDMHVVW